MRFRIHHGQGIISIHQAGDGGCYFKYKRPLVAVWGGEEQFMSMLPGEKSYREEVRNRVNAAKLGEFNGDNWDLGEILYPLFQVFPAGEYGMEYIRSLEAGRGWALLFSTKDHIQAVPKGREKKLYATQQLEEMEIDRVGRYEEKIKRGEKPMVILYKSSFEGKESESFVVDGHHKLIAYYNMKVLPAVVEITHYPQQEEEIMYDVEELITMMPPGFAEHMISQLPEKEKYLGRYLDNPESRIHQLVVHGPKKEYYPNGQLKSEIVYKYNAVDGEANHWYDNGQLAMVYFMRNGRHYADTTTWYDNGQIRFIDPYNSNGELHGCQVSYYPDGKVQMMAWYDNGKSVDGNSYNEWYQTGQKKTEIYYMDGLEVEVREFRQIGDGVGWTEPRP